MEALKACGGGVDEVAARLDIGGGVHVEGLLVVIITTITFGVFCSSRHNVGLPPFWMWSEEVSGLFWAV